MEDGKRDDAAFRGGEKKEDKEREINIRKKRAGDCGVKHEGEEEDKREFQWEINKECQGK